MQKRVKMSPRARQVAARPATGKGREAPAGEEDPKAPAPGPQPHPPQDVILLRIGSGATGVVAHVMDTAPIKRLAAKWMYILRNRSRWANDDDLRLEVSADAVKDLKELGIAEAALKQINASPEKHVEVELLDQYQSGTDSSEAQDAASAFPWEFVISISTTNLGRSEPLLVTRVLTRGGTVPTGQPTSLLFLQSAPGRLSDFYSFESELARLKAATGQQTSWKISDSETLDRIAQRVARYPFQAIHVSAIDNHQAAVIINDFYTEELVQSRTKDGPKDGMVVRGKEIPEDPVPFDQVASALVPLGAHPWLVTCNLYYSSARTAPECIRRGAYAALGFQDEVNDEVAELFFQVFYRSWVLGADAADLPRAFGDAWTELKTQGHDLFGTGIVLWLARSAFERPRPALRSLNEEEVEPPPPALPTGSQRELTRLLPISEVLQVEIDVPEAVNYSLLHNARPFIKKLTLNKLVEHALDEVSVRVDLNVGDGSLPFRHTELLLDTSQRSLADVVRVPLTAPLLRSLRERVQSTLYAKVTWDNRVAYESTHSVTLLPVDEWFDDTQQNPWLPSFVLPRDPAVARIITSARRHLITLLDDSDAGFDGYQSVDTSLDDPAENVDLQVQAIWTALVQEHKLLYINPPPAYSKRTQRLRTPSEILGSSSGTCVDLALLLAACLEYIDVYPVIVLLTGHAFVGYWRNGEDHDKFRRVSRVPASTPIEVGTLSRATNLSLVDRYGWRLAGQQYAEIRQYQRRDELRFLEATGLCFDFSFAEALEEGGGNLRLPEDFDSLLDIRLARLAEPPVTPLPIIPANGIEGPR